MKGAAMLTVVGVLAAGWSAASHAQPAITGQVPPGASAGQLPQATER